MTSGSPSSPARETYRRETREGVEVRKVGNPGQTHHGDVQKSLLPRRGKPGGEGILVVQVHLDMGHHAHHRDVREVFEHLHAGIQDGLVAPEVVDDESLHHSSLVLVQERHGAVEACKDAAPVDVGAQKHRRLGQLRHAHVHNVVGFEIDLRRAARALQDHDLVVGRQALKGGHEIGNEGLFHGKIVPGGHGAPHLAVYNHLRAHVVGGL